MVALLEKAKNIECTNLRLHEDCVLQYDTFSAFVTTLENSKADADRQKLVARSRDDDPNDETDAGHGDQA